MTKLNFKKLNTNFNIPLLLMCISSILFILGLIFRINLRQTPYSWAEYTVFLLAYFLVGSKVIFAAIKNILKKSFFDENFLMTIATLGAIVIGELPEATGVMLFYRIGEALQDRAVASSRKSIKALMDIRPDYARIIKNGKEQRVSPQDIPIGTEILIKPGEKVPIDGQIIKGSSFIDTSTLTGESIPKQVSPGQMVLSGVINMRSPIVLKTSRLFSESSVAKILNLVENAAKRKAPTENFITSFARYYTPAVIFIALGIALIPPLFISDTYFLDWVYRALVLLVISCPCALVISIPMGYFGGIGRASARGILVKGANFLDALTRIHTVVFDKTGTLTTGSFEVTKIQPANGISKNDLLQIAAEAEINSNHPIAQSILSRHRGQVDKDIISNYEEIPGQGIKAMINNNLVLAGNNKLMNEFEINCIEPRTSDTIVHIAVNDHYKGYILISDKLKPSAAKAIKYLKNQKVKNVVMLTGDETTKAEAIANKLGIDSVYSQLLPEDKLRILRNLKNDIKNKSKSKLAYAGDGINDAPAIMQADIGIAMGGIGQDAAIEGADVVIMNDEPIKICHAIDNALFTRKIVIQNIVLSLGVKIVVVIMGAFGLATMAGAVFADVGVALIALINSIRLIHL